MTPDHRLTGAEGHETSRGLRSDSVAEAAHLLGPLVEREVPVGPLTTYRVGGPAALFCRVDSEGTLAAVTDAVAQTGIDTLMVGRGSNLLVADRGFDGLVLVLGSAYEQIAIDGTCVVAGAAAALPVVARRTAAAGLAGFEWAVGVPGSIGGAVRMNAGGHGADMSMSVLRARVVDLAAGADSWVCRGDLGLSYRHSAIAADQLVVEVELGLARGAVEASTQRLGEIVAWRRANQPGGQNAGSVFTNPPGDSAGRLIDAIGAKGLRVGTASVSTKHANFIQADENGSADDVLLLMAEVRRRVRDQTGQVLVPETVLAGFESHLQQEVER